MRAWWDTGRPDDPYSSRSIGGLIHKMTMHDWTVLYEFLGVAFAERADCLAVLLLREVEKQADKNVQPLCPFRCNHQSCTNEEELVSSSSDLIDFSNNVPPSFLTSEEDQASVESLVGRSLWGIVCLLWKRYKHWLMLVFEHCPGLNHEVMVEKARTTAWTTTPTLYEKGVICFRSQVLLKYGLRRVLQSGFSWLSLNDAGGLTSEIEVELLQSIHHLLQEVDVRDDSLSPKAFTQTKMWRCFPVKRSSVVARHFLDEKQKKNYPQ